MNNKTEHRSGNLWAYSVQVYDLAQGGLQRKVVALHISNFASLTQMEAKVLEADKALHELRLQNMAVEVNLQIIYLHASHSEG